MSADSDLIKDYRQRLIDIGCGLDTLIWVISHNRDIPYDDSKDLVDMIEKLRDQAEDIEHSPFGSD